VVATGVGYEGARHTVWKPHSKPVAAATPQRPAAATTHAITPAFRPIAKPTDLKPFRPASVKARGSHRGRPFVVNPNARIHHEVSVLPPSRVRIHDLKPAKPAKPAHTNNGVHTGRGHGKGPAPKKKPPPPPPPRHEPPPLPSPHGKGGGKPS